MRIEFLPENAASRPAVALNGNGRKVLMARYLKRGADGRIIESPDEMFERVARNVAEAEARYGDSSAVECAARAFLEVMKQLEFLPNSPTLMNAGRELQQLSACFVLPIADSLDSIFEAVKHAALIHKSGGGSGFSFSRIRPKGDRVRSTHGVSSGPVSFMRVFDAATDAVKQGGTRRGANMGILRVDHPDILEFIDAKSGTGALRNFNLSIAATDTFMKALSEGTDYPLLHPRGGGPVGSRPAREVFHRICRRAWECGDPGIIFIDTVNRHNPTPELGAIESTNPCGEQPLLPFESCNLGSINLARMVALSNGRRVIDYPRLAVVVKIAIRFLDNVIDVNQYPLPQTAEITRGNRKIGLGVMGWSDMLIKLGVAYGSSEGLTLAEKVMGFVQRAAQRASVELALQRGPFPNQKLSASSGRPSRRNATVTTIAPTGSLSLIAGCSSGIEPPYALSLRRKHVLDGEGFAELHPLLQEDLAARGLALPEILSAVARSGSVKEIAGMPAEFRGIYATAAEIAPEWHVRMQAAFQKHCDNAVSKTVNLPCSATVEEVERIFRLAFEAGCKGITVYRDRCRNSQVLNAGNAA